VHGEGKEAPKEASQMTALDETAWLYRMHALEHGALARKLIRQGKKEAARLRFRLAGISRDTAVRLERICAGAATPSGHAADCHWQLDQYTDECTCGASAPHRGAVSGKTEGDA
jgi:hypothetical protein